VDSVLIVGVDGMVGANLAAFLSGSHPVTGVIREPGVTGPLPVDVVPMAAAGTIAEVLERRRPQRIVYCGSGATSGWCGIAPAVSELSDLANWLQGATTAGLGFTFLSSDAVFTGPWMFHAENSHSHCRSAEAVALRQMEELVLSQRPDALVLRTHAFGWSPATTTTLPNSLDGLLASLGLPTAATFDATRHASPLLVTDLAGVIPTAWSAGLAGVYHVAGAERVNPVLFLQRLANQFGLPYSPVAERRALTDSAVGYGRGETSLQTRKIRRALGISLPMLGEGLARLQAQTQTGERQRLFPSPRTQRAA
jgi:dTDP-4-dehydrorhamnose reductase